MDDSAIICDEVVESYNEEMRSIPTSFNRKNVICKTQNFYILLFFLLTTIMLLVVVTIYCYLIKYPRKFIYYHFTTQN